MSSLYINYPMRYFAELSYKGTGYNGWQRQSNAPSVQQTIEDCISKLIRADMELTGAGRTDTGVHAAYYVAHFDTVTPINDTASFCYHLNAILPADIAVMRISLVGDDAHARFSAIEREYKYYISTVKNPFNRELTWQYYVGLDVEAMNAAAAILTGIDDFTSFAKLHSANKTNICKVSHARWQYEGDTLVFTIRADRFLRNMVRAITGTLVDVGRGKTTIDGFSHIVESRDLSLCGGTAPASGLFLSGIRYPEEIFKSDML